MQLSLFSHQELPHEPDPAAHNRKPTVLIEEAIPIFERYLLGAGKAQQTISNFAGDIRQLARYYPARPLHTLVTADLQLFLGHLQRDHHLSEKTITRKITSFKSFFRFLSSIELVPYDVAAYLIYPALQPQLPDILSDEEMTRLLDVTRSTPLWHALTATLRYAGPKREELLALQRADVDLPGRPPAVTLRRRRPSRYNRDRTVPIPDPLVGILDEYLKQLEGPYLFPLHVRSVQWGLSSYGKQAGITRPLSAQTLRDTYAVTWLKAHVPSETEARTAAPGEAYGALVALHDRQLLELLGLADHTAPATIAKYRGLAQPVGR